MAFFLVCRRIHIARHTFIFSSLFSSATTSKLPLNPNQSETASKFLLNDLGLSYSEISKIQNIYPKFFRTKAPLKRSAEALQLFRSYGLTDDQLKRMFKQCPSIFSLRADEVLRPRVQLVKSLGLSNQELAKTLSRAPRTLGAKNLVANIVFYRSVYNDNANLVEALRKCPSLLGRTPHNSSANDQIKLLKQYGFGNDSIHYIMRRAPLFLSCPLHTMQSHLEFFRNVGFKEPTKTFANALTITIRYSREMLHQKYHHLVALGLTEEEVKQIVRKHPRVLNNSREKLQRIVDYLRSKGIMPGVLIVNPTLCGMSLEKRIIPRYNAFWFLCKTLGKEKAPNCGSLMRMSEAEFIKRYVEGKPHAKRLLKVYRVESKDLPQ